MSIFNSTANSSSARMPIFKFDQMNQNQGRAFGPLLGLLLVNVLAKAVMAKYDSYYPLQFNYDYGPWLPSYKPPSTYIPGPYVTDWYPIENPYNFEHYAYPTLTTNAPPLLSHEHVAEYDDYEYDSRTQDPKNYDLLIPAESNHIQEQSVLVETKTSNAPQHRIVFPKEGKVSVKDPKNIDSRDDDNSLRERIAAPTRGHKTIPTTEDIPTTVSSDEDKTIPAPESTTIPVTESTTIPVTTSGTPISVTTLLQSLLTEEPIAAASNTKVRRHPTQKYKRKGPTRSDRYPQKRRRTTTPAQEYYDSYEDDYTERYQPNRKRRPQYSSSELYYDASSEYYGSFETTTRYYKKQKRRPTRKVTKINKNQNRNDDSFEIETNTERFNPVNPNTEIVIVRQAAPTTTPGTTTTAATTTTDSTTTTTEPMTIITNSTSTPGTTTTSSNNTIGYGPSNGNEHVSFTYGPPTNNYQYQPPYVDWYTHEATKNAIVERVRDIVDVDTRL